MFKLYLDGLITEAVSEKHAGRVVEILQNRIARKFGMQVYVQNGTCKIKKEGEGIEIINSEEFWKVKNYLEANSSK